MKFESYGQQLRMPQVQRVISERKSYKTSNSGFYQSVDQQNY